MILGQFLPVAARALWIKGCTFKSRGAQTPQKCKCLGFIAFLCDNFWNHGVHVHPVHPPLRRPWFLQLHSTFCFTQNWNATCINLFFTMKSTSSNKFQVWLKMHQKDWIVATFCEYIKYEKSSAIYSTTLISFFYRIKIKLRFNLSKRSQSNPRSNFCNGCSLKLRLPKLARAIQIGLKILLARWTNTKM